MLDFSTACAVALKTSLLLVAIGGASLALKRQSAASRHVLLTGALMLSLCMPLLIVCLPSFAVIPASWLHVHSKFAEAVLAPDRAAASSAIWSLGWKVWLAGATAIFLHGLAAHWGLRRWRRSARPLQSQRWAATLGQVTSEWRLTRPLCVLESAATTQPCTWGFFEPVLLLPADGDQWSEVERRHALTHELAHVCRHDYLSASLSRLACAVHWYNPLVWLAAREAQRLQEQACDDLVLRSGAMPSDYAQFLVNAIAHERRRTAWSAAALGIVQRSELRERIIAILDPERARRPLSRASLIGTTASAVCLAVALAAAVPAEPPTPPAPHVPALIAEFAVPSVPAVPTVPPVPAVAFVPAVPPVAAVPATLPDLPAPRDPSNRRRPTSSVNL